MRLKIVNESVLNESKVGYRCEDLFGEGIVDLEDVIRHEMFVLDNNDIPRTVLSNFDASEDEREIIESSGDQDEIVETIINIIHRTYPNAKYCKWLCDSKQDIFDSYIAWHDDGTTIDDYVFDKYEINNDIPIADMGEEGYLYVFDTNPLPIEEKESNNKEIKYDGVIDNVYIDTVKVFKNGFVEITGYSDKENISDVYMDLYDSLSPIDSGFKTFGLYADRGINGHPFHGKYYTKENGEEFEKVVGSIPWVKFDAKTKFYLGRINANDFLSYISK